jgi:hypothetical protein
VHLREAAGQFGRQFRQIDNGGVHLRPQAGPIDSFGKQGF